jgi:RHS repeat-associated protein
MSNALTLEDRRNGNQAQTFTCNTRHCFPHAAENRLVQVSGAASAGFVYDGDGKHLLATEGGTTTVFIGNYFEWSGTPASAVRYYYAGTTRLAMRRGSGSVTWLLGDHLGSTSVSYAGTDALHQGYKPWGETRFGEVGMPYQFTGQYRQASLGLDFFNARWYDPALGRFAQADTVIPEASQGTQAWDRYAYVNNSPLNYIDPTGHDLEQIMFDKGVASWRHHLRNLAKDRSSWADNPFIRNGLIDAISEEYNIDPTLLDDLSLSQLEKLYGIPLEFLEDKENTRFLLDIIDSCQNNPTTCVFEFQMELLQDNLTNPGYLLDLLKVASLPLTTGIMTGIIGAAAVLACTNPISCIATFAVLGPAVGLGILATGLAFKATRIYFRKEFTITTVRFK